MLMKAKKYPGIPELLSGMSPTADQQWRMFARVNAIKHILIRSELTTKDEFQAIEDTIHENIRTRRANKVKSGTHMK
tara:strand:+ start:404 stop:634 length:231 start_codon:yes stop_codon:yes gene_type:complete